MRSVLKLISVSSAAVALSLYAATTANAYKIAVVSDIHYNPKYDPTTPTNQCSQNAFLHLSADAIAPLGRLYCDPPHITVERMLERLALQEPKLDAILVPGDFVAHKVAMDPATQSGGNYTELLEILAAVPEIFNKYFPDTPVIMSFGNNDCKYHYQAPYEEDKEEYYNYIFEHWL